jgi:AraC family transcriptional regulator of adaptative response / DNA-3-methyladenine glycosylase II
MPRAAAARIDLDVPALDARACFRAMSSRDRRFEGRFVTAVRTTHVYCRPGCPAPLPKRQNVTFFQHAAAAEAAGYRPCRRCRPELSPELRLWPDTSRTVTRAIRLIAGGALDGGGTLDELVARLGVGARHLRRLFARHLGASPIALAQTRRVHFARRLLDETALPITDIALAAGFSSVRRFNDVFRRTFARAPSQVRTMRQLSEDGGVTLRLPFARPFDWDALLAFLSARAIPGVEAVADGAYRRSIDLDGTAAAIEVRHAAGEDWLRLRVLAASPIDLLRVVERVRRLFDLDCDPKRIASHLGRDKALGSLVRAHPGLRVPGAWDPFEMAVRAILGQQVSVRGASTLAGRIAVTFGAPSACGLSGVTHQFPAASRLAGADLRAVGMPATRAAAIQGLARAVAEHTLVLDGSQDLDTTVAALTALPGIGPWTAHYIAMRSLGEPDALPADDLGIRKALTRNGRRPSRAEILNAAEAWRPFRAYAVMHLWRSLK